MKRQQATGNRQQINVLTYPRSAILEKRCKLSTRPIKIVPIKQTGCHVVLRQRMEERARIKLARSHSDVVVFKRMGMQVDEAIELPLYLALHPPLKDIRPQQKHQQSAY
ncbi:MAG: hypothetical protein RLP02_27700 [Coleofasciculus sp. C2-GNP5-27]